MLRALDLPLVAPHLALGQRHVGVAADVADGVDVVADAHDGDRRRRRPRPGAPCPASSSSSGNDCRGHRHHADPGQGAVEVELGRDLVAQLARRAAPTGSWSSTSSKKPSTMSRSAIAVGMPRLSR